MAKAIQQVGFELEMYHDATRAELINHIQLLCDKLRSKNTFAVGSDGSVDNYRVAERYRSSEVRSLGPQPIRNLNLELKKIHLIASDPSIDAAHIGLGEKKLTETDGHSGLHIHFGLSKSYMKKRTMVDFLKFAISCQENYDEIIELAGRETRWACSPASVLNQLKCHLDSLLKHYQPYSWTSTQVLLPPSFGARIHNAWRSAKQGYKTTIEMRWAASALCQDQEKLKKYTYYCLDLLEKTFVGATELEYKGFRIVAKPARFSGNLVNYDADVFYDGNLIGHLKSCNENL